MVIGIDPYKGSHAAAAVDGGDMAVAELEVKASKQQTRELLAWAERFGDRRWAGGVGERPRVSVGATVGGCWGACGRRALDSRLESLSVGFDEVAEERRQ